MITRQSTLVDDLNSQLEQLKEVNSQLEYSWSQKYREMAELKDSEFDKLQRESNQKVTEIKKKSEGTMKNLLADFKDDMNTVENTHKNKQRGADTSVAKLENKTTKQAKMIEELKNLL